MQSNAQAKQELGEKKWNDDTTADFNKGRHKTHEQGDRIERCVSQNPTELRESGVPETAIKVVLVLEILEDRIKRCTVQVGKVLASQKFPL